MAQGADAIGQHAGERQVGLIARQPQGQSAERLGHGGAIDHAQHRYTEVPRQVSAGRRAVEQAHHAFDEDQVSLPRCLPEQAAAFLLAHHPHVQLVHRRATGTLVDHRVEKVRPAFEHAHLASQVAVQTGERGGDRGFALAGRRSGDQYGRAMTGLIQSSTPFCALIPAWNACLSMPISVTVSPISISSGLAPRPVTTTCCMGGRACRSLSTWSRSR